MIELNYKVYGQGEALIILHGLFGSLDNWVSHARSLSEDYSVYLLDQRNHGKSPHEDEWTYPAMAEDLYEFMNQQGIYQAHLLGHSMGGKTVMEFSRHYPEMIDKLIVADMTPKQYPPHHTEILETLISLDLSTLDSRRDAKAKLEERISDPSVVQFLLKSLGRDEDKAFRWKFNLQVIYDNYERVLDAISFDEEVDVPSLFIYGGESPYLQEEDKAPIQKVFPQASFHKLEGAGHWVHAEKPLEFLAQIQKYLAS
ncbi:MAG: alpha/beta fold hydrolase [Bacteroidota bacterium]